MAEPEHKVSPWLLLFRTVCGRFGMHATAFGDALAATSQVSEQSRRISLDEALAENGEPFQDDLGTVRAASPFLMAGMIGNTMGPVASVCGLGRIRASMLL